VPSIQSGANSGGPPSPAASVPGARSLLQAIPIHSSDPTQAAPLESSSTSSPALGLAAVPGPAGRRGPMPQAELDALLHHATVAAWKTFAFHATKTSALEGEGGIGRAGLDPAHGGTGAASGSETQVAQSRGKVHYTRRHEHAQGYRKFFEGEAYGSRMHPAHLQGPAQVLQLSLHSDVLASEERDQDDNSGYTTTQRIRAENIRRLNPTPLADSRQQGARGWLEHQLRGLTSLEALKSNLSIPGRLALRDLRARGLNEGELLQMVKNAMMANPAATFMPAYSSANPRSSHDELNAAGLPLLGQK
jgi:hypothetical protein